MHYLGYNICDGIIQQFVIHLSVITAVYILLQ